MNNDLVTFKVAKLAKEKGFNFFCEKSYTLYKKTTKYHKRGNVILETDFMEGRNSFHKRIDTEYYEMYSAPIILSLQKWLKEKHNILISNTKTNKMLENNLIKALNSIK